jgi:hypothetical protein
MTLLERIKALPEKHWLVWWPKDHPSNVNAEEIQSLAEMLDSIDKVDFDSNFYVSRFEGKWFAIAYDQDGSTLHHIDGCTDAFDAYAKMRAWERCV